MSGDSLKYTLDLKEQVNLLSVTKPASDLHKSTSCKFSKDSKPIFKFQNIKALSPHNSSLMHAKKCDSSDSDPVFRVSSRNTRKQEKVRKNSSSSESDPVFKTKTSSSRKSRKRPARKSPTRKVSKEACSSSSEDCPVPPARSPPKRKRTESSSKSPAKKKNQVGCSCGKEPERPKSIIRNILCFLGIERRRKNGSEDTKSCGHHHHHHKCTCQNRKSMQNPERKVRPCQRESKSSDAINENEKSQKKPSVDTDEVKNECSDATVEDHSACPCSYCPLRFSEVPSLDDIYLTEEVGNLIAEAIKETVCQQLEEKLSNIEDQIKDNERTYWAEYIAPSMCPRCSSKDFCRLHNSPSNQTRRCHRCDNR